MIDRLRLKLAHWLVRDLYRRVELLEMRDVTPSVDWFADSVMVLSDVQWCAKRLKYQVTVRLYGKKNETRTVLTDDLTERSIKAALR